MTKRIYVLNGPNLNRLGTREPEIYGKATLADVESACRASAGGHEIVFRQSNAEGQIVDWIHEAIDAGADGLVINPAGLTFTSVPIMDALKMFGGPIFELHITQHPPPRERLSRVAGLEGRDRRHRGPRPRRLPHCGRGDGAAAHAVGSAASFGSNPSSTNACRAPSTPATRRVMHAEPRGGLDVDRVVVDEQHAPRPERPSASRTCSKYSASGLSLPTRYDGKL